ncbi:MAG: hypothetical protein EOO32_00065 [Comamonadaceae bacterium]|nr:MAG: hypothetical protein EOO32_00065 [Comamonadaceae bacterium]
MSVPYQLEVTPVARRRIARRLVLCTARVVRGLLMAMGLLIALPAVVSVAYDRFSDPTTNGGDSHAHVCTQPSARH